MSDFKSKEILAKLFAEENLNIEHKNVSTACFDPETRTMTLPIWKDMDNSVYNMITAHESAHCLYSPSLSAIPEELNNSYVNVVEDARIDKLIKRKYPGLSRDYQHGYKYLLNNNFFGTKGRDIDSYPFIDRINLYFKGNPLIYFSETERAIVNQIEQIETFDEVLDIVRVIQEEMVQQQVELQKISGFIDVEDIEKMDNPIDDGDSDEESESNNNPENSDGNSDSDDESQAPNDDENSDTDVSDITLPDSLTESAWQRNMTKLLDNDARKQISVTIPKINFESHIVPWERVNAEINTTIQYARESVKYGYDHNPSLDACIEEYKRFKNHSITTVNYLVKEFEMKKSADAYSKARIAKTGVINTNKLYSYHWNEDIFRKSITLPEGKNHGFLMFIDWSGSMSDKLIPTIKQLYNLIWFCRKVNIPYEIYSFNSNMNVSFWGPKRKDPTIPFSDDNTISFDETFLLPQFFTSKMNNIQTENQMKTLWILAHSVSYEPSGKSLSLNISDKYKLGNTPLNETIIISKYVADKFLAKNKVQKLHFIYLTDGEGAPMYINSNELSTYLTGKYSNQNYYPVNISYANNYNARIVLKDRNNQWNLTSYGGSYVQAGILLEWLKSYYPQSNTISFRIASDNDARSIFNLFGMLWEDKVRNVWSKEGFCQIKNMYGFSSDFLIRFNQRYVTDYDSQELEIDNTATKSAIARKLSKHLKNRMQSKMLLRNFISLVA